MIWCPALTDESVGRVVRLSAPPGCRILTGLEVIRPGDLTGNEKDWRPAHPANYGRRASGVIAAATPGRSITEIWILPSLPEDFIQITAIDRAGLERLAEDGVAAPSLFWECTRCGEPYQKGSPHVCPGGGASYSRWPEP